MNQDLIYMAGKAVVADFLGVHVCKVSDDVDATTLNRLRDARLAQYYIGGWVAVSLAVDEDILTPAELMSSSEDVAYVDLRRAVDALGLADADPFQQVRALYTVSSSVRRWLRRPGPWRAVERVAEMLDVPNGVVTGDQLRASITPVELEGVG